ncbi:hypothetical protein PFISCL1PPCAC_19024, partial [Pristionchus fissidentatus]
SFVLALLTVTSHCDEMDTSGRSHIYSGPLAAADRVVESFYEEYPQLGEYDEKEAREFKKEIVTLREEKEDEYEALMKSPLTYPILSDKLEKLRKLITSKASEYASVMNDLKDKEKTDRFLMYLIVNTPVLVLEKAWKEYSEKNELDEEEIEDQKEENEDDAHDAIYGEKESIWFTKRKADEKTEL